MNALIDFMNNRMNNLIRDYNTLEQDYVQEGATFESVRSYLSRSQRFMCRIFYTTIERALDLAEREDDREQRDHLYQLIRDCASPFLAPRASVEAYLNRTEQGSIRDIIAELL
jgi:predicted patatin/cPLA2 family phospholipase